MISEEVSRGISEVVRGVVDELSDSSMSFVSLYPEQFRSRFGITRRSRPIVREIEHQLLTHGVEHLPRSIPTSGDGMVVLFAASSAVAEQVRAREARDSVEGSRSGVGAPR